MHSHALVDFTRRPQKLMARFCGGGQSNFAPVGNVVREIVFQSLRAMLRGIVQILLPRVGPSFRNANSDTSFVPAVAFNCRDNDEIPNRSLVVSRDPPD